MSAPKDLVRRPGKRKCPGSFSNLGRQSITPNPDAPPLRRWKATWRALSDGLGDKRPVNPPQESFDRVQKAIVSAQINRVKPLLPTSDRGEFDFEWPRLTYPIGHDQLEVFFQFTHAEDDGVLKMYRLKTAQITEDDEFVSAPEEIAAVVSDPRFPDSLEAYEIRTADGEMIRLEMPEPRAGEVLAKLERDYRAMSDAHPGRLHPGWHCSMCDVADLCPTFPAIGPSTPQVVPPGRRLPSAHRLMISKTRLGEMDLCQRRVAWRTWFAIPADLDHRDRDTSPDLAVGNRFHRRMAQALLSEDPQSFFAGDPELEDLYRQHQDLPCTEGLRIRATEFPLGFTVRLRSDGQLVSVVTYGLADAVDREPDGTPAIVDHKTGRSGATNPYEEQIYALGALLRIGGAAEVSTHIHQLSTRGEQPTCHRTVWDRERLPELASRMVKPARTAAGWDLSDATSPPYRAGDWCNSCPFEKRCLAYR